MGRDLEWCIVRPGGLTVEKPTGVINARSRRPGAAPSHLAARRIGWRRRRCRRRLDAVAARERRAGASVAAAPCSPKTYRTQVIEGEAGSIARADVADFCIGAILEKDFPYIRKTPCISSVGGTSWVKDRSAAVLACVDINQCRVLVRGTPRHRASFASNAP